MYYFTSDEHYGHDNIRAYSNRPFDSVQEMDNELISRHNAIVKKNDTVIHAGDFSLIHNYIKVYDKYISKLNGKHIFLKGSHDYWLPENHITIYQKKIYNKYIVVCHYAMRVWARSHYNSYMLHGHSHGTLKPIGKQLDIGVDNNNYYPFSFKEIEEIMKKSDNNFNYIDREQD
jgi:calcineurin-like phosphoesterase family protein